MLNELVPFLPLFYCSLQITSGRRLQPTKLGISLVNGCMTIDPELVMPSIRASIESQCKLVAEGKADKQDLVRHTLAEFKLKFFYFVSKVSKKWEGCVF